MKEAILMPIRAMKVRYIPLLAVYFTLGLAALSSITSTFFFKNVIKLSAADLITLGIWVNLPWSIKMVFGAMIDGFTLFGNNRKSYIYLGNFMIFLGCLGMVDHSSTRILIDTLGPNLALMLTGIIGATGVVISDIIADTMAIEVVEEGPNKDQELGLVQVLSRLALATGGVLGAAIAGYLAQHFSAATVFGLETICPLISTIGVTCITLPRITTKLELNKPIFYGGLAYSGLVVIIGTVFREYGQLLIFTSATLIISLMLAKILKEVEPEIRKSFIYAMLAIFLFRVGPGIGPSITWFYIEKLHFDEIFLGTLGVITSVSSLVLVWLMASSITKYKILPTMGAITGLLAVLAVPDLLVYYGVHETLGISARHMILVDSALIAPISSLAMIPLGVIIAKHAPDKSRAIYISLTACLMNIALVGSSIITAELNKIFVVTRTDFTQLGHLMISSLSIWGILSLVGLGLLAVRKI